MVALLLIEIWVALYSLMSKVSFVEARLRCVLRRLLLLKRTDNAPISDILFENRYRQPNSFFHWKPPTNHSSGNNIASEIYTNAALRTRPNKNRQFMAFIEIFSGTLEWAHSKKNEVTDKKQPPYSRAWKSPTTSLHINIIVALITLAICISCCEISLRR